MLPCTPVSELKQAKVHLFGRWDITYGPPQWREVYPVFRPHPKVNRSPGEEKHLRRIRRGYLSIWAVLLAVVLLNLSPRYVLMPDGGVRDYNCFAQISKVYEWEDVECVRFQTFLSGAGKSRDPSFEVILTTDDAQQFRFQPGDFQGEPVEWLQALLRLREVYGPDVAEAWVDPRYPLEDVVKELRYTPEEAELLYQLFGQ